MKTTNTILLALALGASTCLLTAQDSRPSPQGHRPPMHEGGPGVPGGFHLLPPPAQEQLNLSAEQQKQIAALEEETKAKLEKILTPEQLKQLQRMGPPMHPPGGPMGPGRQGGPGGASRPQRPALEP